MTGSWTGNRDEATARRGLSMLLSVHVLVGNALAWQRRFVLLMAALARLHQLRVRRHQRLHVFIAAGLQCSQTRIRQRARPFLPIGLLRHREVIGARARKGNERAGSRHLDRVLRNEFPVPLGLWRLAFSLDVPQRMTRMIDNRHHLGVDADRGTRRRGRRRHCRWSRLSGLSRWLAPGAAPNHQQGDRAKR